MADAAPTGASSTPNALLSLKICDLHNSTNSSSAASGSRTALPSRTHQLVFSCLRSLWRHRSVPNWWLNSYLHPIPKKGAATLDNLRPLGLYEITRKLLAAIIIKRAYRIWEKLQLLHPHQHAYHRGMGTGTAILRLLNLIEDDTSTFAADA